MYLNVDIEDNGTDILKEFIIDSVSYIIRLRYNTRSGWQFTIYDSELYDTESLDNTRAILLGEKKIIPFQNILKHHANSSLPDGYLTLLDVVYRNRNDYKMPDNTDIGSSKRFRLNYLTKEEVEAAGGEV